MRQRVFGTAADRRTLFACFAKLHHGTASLFAAMLISVSILLTASLLRSLRFNAHIKKLRRETSESILRRRILVSPEVDEVIRSLHRSSSEYPNQACSEQSATRSFYLLRTEKAITFDDILPIIREALEKGISHIVIYSVSKPEPEAESAVRTVGTTAVEFRLLETIPQIRERFLPDDAEIDAEIKAAFPPAERVSVRVRAERAASKLRTENTLQSTSLRAWDYMPFVFFGVQVLYAVCSLGNDVRRNAAVYPQNNRILQTRRQPALTADISSKACFIPPAEHSDRGCRPASKARALSEISGMSMRRIGNIEHYDHNTLILLRNVKAKTGKP